MKGKPQRLLTLAEVCREYKVTAQQVEQDAEDDRLDVYEMNGAVGFLKADLDRLYSSKDPKVNQ